MKKIIYAFLFFLLNTSLIFAQSTLLIDRSKEGQSQPAPKTAPVATVTPEKPKSKKNNHEGKVLSNGFCLTAIAGANRGLTNGRAYTLNSYRYDYYYSSQTDSVINYNLENSIGYRGGFGIGFQTRGYAFEFPCTFNVDRFKIPQLSTSYGLKVSSIEYGINNYFKFTKSKKHYILLGPYIAFDIFDYDFFDFGFNLHSYGINFGYGFSFTKRLNLSLRYKFNVFSIADRAGGDNTAIYFSRQADYNDNYNLYSRTSQYNSLQLVLRFDLINTRRWKDPKAKIEPRATPVVKETKAPVKKIAVDYSTLSDAALLDAKKEAKNLDDIIAIDKELEKRKAVVSEFDKYTDAQLKELLDATIVKEEYDKAETIKNEIKKREAIEKNKVSDPNSLENKSIEELTKLMNDAAAKEDYDTAEKIKEIINKKKK